MSHTWFMENTTLKSKLRPVVSYLPKKELAKLFPLQEFRSVTQVVSDPRRTEWFKKEVTTNPEGCVAKAVRNGTRTHAALEKGVAKDELSQAVLSAFNREIAIDLDEVWGLEEWLAHPLRFKGRFDGVGVYRGKVTLFDHKKTNKRKTLPQVKGYFNQLAAYKMAHEHLYPQVQIEQVAVLNLWGTDPSNVGAQSFVLSAKEAAAYESFIADRCL